MSRADARAARPSCRRRCGRAAAWARPGPRSWPAATAAAEAAAAAARDRREDVLHLGHLAWMTASICCAASSVAGQRRARRRLQADRELVVVFLGRVLAGDEPERHQRNRRRRPGRRTPAAPASASAPPRAPCGATARPSARSDRPTSGRSGATRPLLGLLVGRVSQREASIGVRVNDDEQREQRRRDDGQAVLAEQLAQVPLMKAIGV